MIDYMPRFAVREPSAQRRRLIVEEAPRPSPPPLWRVLAAVHGMRLQRAAGLLARAERDMHDARARERRAEAELTRLFRHADRAERERHARLHDHVAQGRDILAAHAVQARLGAQLATQARVLRASADTTVQTRRLVDQARRQHRTAAQNEAKFQAFLQPFNEGGSDR